MPSTADHLETTRRYLTALEAGATGDALTAFFTPDVVVEEFPNRISPNGSRRDLSAILEAAVRGRQLMRSQRYEIIRTMASGDTVALEARWTGVLAVPLGTLPAGAEMRDRFAAFIEFRDGRIARQRTYDCFEPW